MVSHAGAVRDVTEAAVPRFAAILAAVLPLGLLVQVLGGLRDYRHPAVPVAVWFLLLAAAWWLIPRVRDGGLTRGQSAVAVGVALASVTAVGWDRRPDVPAGALDWSILGAVWLLALAALSRPAWEWVPGALLVLAVNGFFILRLLGTAAPGFARLAAAAYVVVVILGVFAALRPTLRVHASLAARRAELASRLAAERAAVAAIQEDRRDRFALLELEALPLLRGVADGSLDPAGEAGAPAVRPARHQPAARPGRPGPPRPRAPGRAGSRAQRGPAARSAGRDPGGGGSWAAVPGGGAGHPGRRGHGAARAPSAAGHPDRARPVGPGPARLADPTRSSSCT